MSSFENKNMENDFIQNKKLNEVSNFGSDNKNESGIESKVNSNRITRPNLSIQSNGFKKGSNNSLNSPTKPSSPGIRKNPNGFKKHNSTKNKSGGSSLESLSNSNSSLHKRRSQNNSYSKNHNPYAKYNNSPAIIITEDQFNGKGDNDHNNDNNGNDNGNGSTNYDRKNSLHSLVLKNSTNSINSNNNNNSNNKKNITE